MTTTTKIKLTSRWTTICTVGYTGSVSRDENRAAHGGVCHIQLRQSARGPVARKINSNGRHKEVGEVFAATTDQIEHWATIAASSR
jgi:hypothetical protein